MIIEWSYELIVATIALLLAFGLSVFWSRNFIKAIFLFVGFLGLFLAIVQPFQSIEKSMKSTEVGDIHKFLASESMKWTDTVNLLGFNHEIADVELLGDYIIKQVDSLLPTGFSDVSIPEALEGEEFVINGRLETSQDSIQEVWLESPSEEKFEATIEDQATFVVKLKVAVKGLYEFQLNGVNNSGDTISEVLPIQVKSAEKLGMLIIGNSPQFEFNYLKNYWVNEGHAIVQKVKISQEKYSSTYVNMPEFSFNALNSRVLDKFDVLLIDMISWNNFSAGQRNQILGVVRENGLGLALKPNKVGDIPKSLPYAKVLRFKDEEINHVQLNLAEIEHNKAWESMSLAKKMDLGFGTVLLLELSDSYQLILNDEAGRYHQIWGKLLSELFIRKNEGFVISTPFLTYENESVQGRISYLDQEDRLVHNDSIYLAVNFIPFLDEDGEAMLMPSQGWNKVSKKGSDETQWFYAFEEGSWEAMKASQFRKYLDWMQMNKRDEVVNTYKVNENIPWWISMVLVVFGFGVVWLMEKLGK